MTSAATARGTGSAAGQPAARVVAAVAAGLLGPGYHPEVPARVLALLDRTPTRRDRDQLLGVLRVLDSLAGALFGITMVAGYGWPGPARDATGYPGPLGTAPDVPRRLTPLALAGDQELSCDVVVVGSGAGGGVAAAELARRGLDVVVLEKGGYAAERDFHHVEGDAYQELYLYGLTLTTDDLACRILAGSTLGGGTVVNYATSFPTPEGVLAEWAEVSGVEAFVSGEVAASLEAVAERVGVTTGQSGPGVRDALMERGLERLGWHVG